MNEWIGTIIVILGYLFFVLFVFLQREEDRLKEGRIKENRKLLKNE